jgi:phosphoribosyl 1,2-cyclic phosphodiesterase
MKIWCDFSAESRARLFLAAPEVVRETGWYPMVTGSFMYLRERWVENAIKQLLPSSDFARDISLGRFEKLASVLQGSEGTSFFIKTSKCGILLDCGFSWKSQLHERGGIMVVSHTHSDHCGGLPDAFSDLSPAAVFMSHDTLRLLGTKLMLDRERGKFEEIVRRTVLLGYGDHFQFSDGSSISFLDANHMPGAVMSLIRFIDQTTLFYSGDCCIDNFFGHIEPVKKSVQELVGSDKLDVMLLDATRVGRKLPVSQEEGGASELLHLVNLGGASELLIFLKTFARSLSRTSIVVDNPDVGVRVYELIYRNFMQGKEKLHNLVVYMDIDIYEFMTWLASGYNSRELQNLDPVLRELCSARKNPFENVLLYVNDYGNRTVENLNHHIRNHHSIIFLVIAENIQRLVELSNAVGTNCDCAILLGRCGESLPESILSDFALRTERLTGDIWSLHSSEVALNRLLESYREEFGKVFLFHNFPNRVKSFCQSFGPSVTSVPYSANVLMVASKGKRRCGGGNRALEPP